MTATDPRYTLVIGTKNWSSWSLRPWLLMRVAGIPFAEVEIPLRETGSPAALARHSPTGLVPVLKVAGGPQVWDSLAIAEYLNECHPDRRLWPDGRSARAHARSVSAEMHAGFATLRREMPMDILGRYPGTVQSTATAGDIARICALWREARADYAQTGPFLFGQFSIADAMYAPVVTRFITYGVSLGPTEQAYADTIASLPAMAEWRAACAAWAARRS